MNLPDKMPHNSPQGQKRLFTLKEAAQYLGRSVWSMRELIWAGVIPVVRQEGGRKIYLDKIDLDRKKPGPE
jgi:excisionase family DNA binding protein